MMLASDSDVPFGPVLAADATDQALPDSHVIVCERITQANHSAAGEANTLGILASFPRHPDRSRERRHDRGDRSNELMAWMLEAG